MSCLEPLFCERSVELADETFLEYTKRWLKCIDRGGLKKLMKHIGYFMKLSELLESYIALGETEEVKAEIIAAIADDCDVHFSFQFHLCVQICTNANDHRTQSPEGGILSAWGAYITPIWPYM